MKKIFLVLTLSLTFLCFSQKEFYEGDAFLNLTVYYTDFRFNSLHAIDETVDKNSHVSARESVSINKKGKLLLKQRFEFNEQGALTYNHNFFDERWISYTDTNVTTVKIKRKKDTYFVTFSYNEFGNCNGYDVTKNGAFQENMILLRYKDTKLIVRQERNYLFHHRRKNVTAITEFDELTEKRKKYQVYLNKKLIQTVTYTCDDKGEIGAKKMEDGSVTSSLCKYSEENRDGSYIEFVRYVDRKKPYLMKNTFSKDSVMLCSEKFLQDSILVNRYTKKQNEMINERYSKKGKLQGIVTTKSNEIGQIVLEEYQDKRKKVYSSMTAVYDSNGLIMSLSNTKSGYTTSYSYTFYNE